MKEVIIFSILTLIVVALLIYDYIKRDKELNEAYDLQLKLLDVVTDYELMKHENNHFKNENLKLRKELEIRNKQKRE